MAKKELTCEQHLAKLRRYCEVNNDSKMSWDDKRSIYEKEFGADDGDMVLEYLIDDLPDYLAVEEAGSFDSPGYDMNSWAVAWVKDDGSPGLETFIEESY